MRYTPRQPPGNIQTPCPAETGSERILIHDKNTSTGFTGGCQPVKKASQSLPPAGGKGILIIFCRGVYLTENTTQAASVRLVRCKRTRRARSRLQSFCQKRAKPFFDSLTSTGFTGGCIFYAPGAGTVLHIHKKHEAVFPGRESSYSQKLQLAV